MQPIVERKPNPLPAAIVFATAVGVFPLAYALDLMFEIGWFGAAISGFALASVLAVGAFRLIAK